MRPATWTEHRAAGADRTDPGSFLRTVLVVARRELLVEMRQRNKLVLDLTGHLLGLAPVLLTAWAASGGQITQRTAVGGVDWLTFLVLGYVAFAAYGVASPVISFTGMPFALHQEQIQGTLERSLLAPAPRLAVVLGSGAYCSLLYLFHVLSLLLACAVFLNLAVFWTPGTALLAGVVLALIFVMSAGFGIVSAAVLLTWKDASLMMIVLHRPMLLLSGAYFLIPSIPEPFRTLAYLNPIAYAIDAFRGSLTGQTILLSLPGDLAVLLVSSVLMVVVGLYLFRRLMARWMRTGALGIY